MEVPERLTVRDLPVEERPRERLAAFGAQALSNAELLALILRTGTTKDNVITVSNKLLAKNDGDLAKLFSSSLTELSQTDGIGPAKSAQIQACFELGKRFAATKHSGERPVIKTSEDVAALVGPSMRFLDKEVFKVILLDSRNRVLKVEDVSVGTLNASLVHPREVFKAALKESAASVILVHNHPSGDPTPSEDDIKTTINLKKGGSFVGITLKDHIIIGSSSFASVMDGSVI